MKILSIRSARSIWLVPSTFLNPNGKYLRPSLPGLVERYKFERLPPPGASEMEKDGLKFESGAFTAADGTQIALNFTIHADGLVVESRSSTANNDAFLTEVLAWISSAHGTPSPAELPIRRIYTSEIMFSLDAAPRIFNNEFEKFCALVSETLGTERSGPLGFAALGLGADPQKVNQPPGFRFEREAGASFDENRFYSFAPCETSVHLKLLRALTESATGPRA